MASEPEPEPKVSGLRAEVTCPVCLEVPRHGGLFQCPKGHLICEEDHARLPEPKNLPRVQNTLRKGTACAEQNCSQDIGRYRTNMQVQTTDKACTVN